jgi:caffeoyl-CoA O-methyltransferase
MPPITPFEGRRIVEVEISIGDGRLLAVSELISAAADGYAERHTSPFTDDLAGAAAWTRSHTSWPGMMAGLAEARLLEALIVVGGARRVLEVGTFTGVGALAMAAALPADGKVTTLEVNVDNAAVARRHFDESPFGRRIELLVGDALETIAGLKGPFDLIWIDAWKSDYPAYYDALLPKLAPRGVIAADNLFRDGEALDDAAASEGAAGIREFARLVHEDERVHNVLLTIGDGVMLAWRRPGD